MEDLVLEVEGKFKASITDSTMMLLLQQAMDKAHEKLKSRQGLVARLNEISKFYELAVMQLDGCLKFVHEETGSYILESDHEELLLDLRDIRDRLQSRLRETELAICEKDRELVERSEYEQRLKQALEMKEKEMMSMQANLKRTRSETVEEFIKSNLEGMNEERDGEISELKSSVDKQVMSIRQKLEPSNDLLAVEERNSGVDNKKIEKMGVDIDVLKGTLDIAFSKMHDAIFLSELGPIEQTWGWSIEKDVVAILIRGFMEDFRMKFEVERKKRDRRASIGLRDNFLDFGKEMSFILRELEHLAKESEVQLKGMKECSDSSTSKIAKSLSEGDCDKQADKPEEEAGKEDVSNFVAKMVKNHESIIRMKSRELILPKPEPIKRQKSIVSPGRRIEQVIARLDNLINLNTKLDEDSGGDGGVMWKRTCPAKRVVSEVGTKDEDKVTTDGLDDVWEKMHNKYVPDEAKEDLRDEMRTLQQEKEDADLQSLILEDTYMTLFKGLISGFYSELHTHDLWSLITEYMHEKLIKEIVAEGSEKTEREKIKAKIREDVYNLVLSEATKDLSFSHVAVLEDCPDCLENMLKEDVHLAFFREILNELSKHTESCREEGLFRRDIDWIIFEGILEDVHDAAKHIQSELIEVLDAKNEEVIQKDVILANALLMPCQKLLRVIDDFEVIIHGKLGMTAFRAEKLSLELHPLIKHVASLREKESVYRKAFYLRCENLQKAETEVDLLADQVDALLGLLERTHLTLRRHPLVLQQYPEISDISWLIKKEFFGVLDSDE